MHIEKNVFEQIINTVMNVKDKTKDDLKDMLTHCKCRRLHVRVVKARERSRQEVMPQAPNVLQKEHRKVVCEWICKLKFPDGYALNLSRCVDMRNASLHNLKSHDCLVFMQRLLPLAFRDLLPTNVWNVLTELS